MDWQKCSGIKRSYLVKLVWIFGKIIHLYYIRKFNRKRYKWFNKKLVYSLE